MFQEGDYFHRPAEQEVEDSDELDVSELEQMLDTRKDEGVRTSTEKTDVYEAAPEAGSKFAAGYPNPFPRAWGGTSRPSGRTRD